MTKTLMITVSVAALIAAGGMAFAQGVNAPRDPAAAAAPAHNGKSDKMKVESPRKTEAIKPAPSAQLPAKSNGVKSETTGQGSTMQPVQHEVETPHKTEAVKPAPNAQLPAKPAGVKSETSGQGTGMQPAQRDTTTPNDRFAPKGPAQADAQHAAPAPLSAEHHAKIWEAVRGEKPAPFTGARFSITVGEAVPQAVHLNRLPVRVIEFAPQYRGYEYVLVGDEIVIVDPRTHRIVAVIPA
jgi:uncharacterized protein DUF1236